MDEKTGGSGHTQHANREAPGPKGSKQLLPIGEISTEAGAQVRAVIDDAIVEEYAEHLQQGGESSHR